MIIGYNEWLFIVSLSIVKNWMVILIKKNLLWYLFLVIDVKVMVVNNEIKFRIILVLVVKFWFVCVWISVNVWNCLNVLVSRF